MKIEFTELTDSLLLEEGLDIENNTADQSSPLGVDRLSEGIEAAQNGDRAQARNLLLRVVEDDPGSETAWLWLASISEYPEELLIFLQNVLDINPNNERALKWIGETKTLLAKTFIQRGVDAENDGNKDFAKQCFLQAIVHDSKSELAWTWLASVSSSDEEKVSHFRKVININPNNTEAAESLERSISRIAKSNFTKAESAFFDGDHQKAEKLVNECLSSDPNYVDALILKTELSKTVVEKMTNLEKVLKLHPDHEGALALLETAKVDQTVSELASAQTALDEGNKVEADEFLDKIISESPGVIDAWLLRVEAADSANEKIIRLNKVLEIDPDNEVAISQLETQKNEKAKTLVSQAKEAIWRSEKAKARQLIEEALKNAPDFEEAIIMKCELIDSVEEKIELLNFVVAKNPNNQTALDKLGKIEKQKLENLLADAHDAINSDKMELAKEMLRIATQISPSNEDVLLLECELSDSSDKKIKILDDLLAINPENEKALKVKGKVDLELAKNALADANVAATSGLLQDAEDLLDQAFRYYPKLEGGWLLKAHLSDSFESKIECFERVLEINPDNEVAKANLRSLNVIVEEANIHETVERNIEVYGNVSREDSLETEQTETVEIKDQEPEVVAPVDEVVEFEDVIQDDENNAVEAVEAVSEILPEDELEESESQSDEQDIQDGSLDYEITKPADAPNPVISSSDDPSNNQDESDDDYENSDADDSLIEVSIDPTKPDENAIDIIDDKVKQILVVDDSVTIRKLIAGKLEKSGLKTVCAIDGVDAMEKIEETVPDLVLLDISMPRMDGYQVCKMIRENELTKDVPVIMVSGKDGFFDKALGKLAGSTSYISKPFGPEALMKIVNEHLT